MWLLMSDQLNNTDHTLKRMKSRFWQQPLSAHCIAARKSVQYLALALSHIYKSPSQDLNSMEAEIQINKQTTNPAKPSHTTHNWHTALLWQGLNTANILCWLARNSLLNSPFFVFGKARIHPGRKAPQPSGSQQKTRVSFYHSTGLFHPHCRKDYAKGHCFLSSGRLESHLRRQKF